LLFSREPGTVLLPRTKRVENTIPGTGRKAICQSRSDLDQVASNRSGRGGPSAGVNDAEGLSARGKNRRRQTL
jgi:hypothetical protein